MGEFSQIYDAAIEKPTSEANAVARIGDKRRRKKKSGAFGIFRAALFVLRKHTGEKEAKKEKSNRGADNGDWKNIVGSMRPLHVQATHQLPANECYSPVRSISSSCGTMSQYASAQDLRGLCNCEDEERDPDEVFDAIAGDEMIDSKAEEFIAQFYRQIHHQNSVSQE